MLHTTVPDLLDARALDSPRHGIAFPDGRMDYPALAAATRRLAAALWAYGVRPGDSVGVLLQGGMDSILTWLAATRIGAVTVPVNVRFKSAELGHVIANADLTVLLTSTAFTELIAEACPGLGSPAAPALRTVVVLDDD